jgi:hypothetical protein
MAQKLTSFTEGNQEVPVSYIGTIEVAIGVTCDTYSFEGDDSRDLAIVHVKAGYKTPLQRVLSGKQTVEGFVYGEGTLSVTSGDEQMDYIFPGDVKTVAVEIDDLMQWTAKTDLIFYEICTPPYQDGRFENLSS